MVNQSLVILCLHYTRYLLDGFSCRHEILSGIVWTRQQLCNTSFPHIAHRIWIFTCAAPILKLEPSDWHNHWLLVARLARRIFALLKKSQRIMWLEFLSWAAKELFPSEHSLIHLINDLIHKDLCFYKGTLLQILLLWDGHDWKNGVTRTEINKRRINVRALATLRNYWRQQESRESNKEKQQFCSCVSLIFFFLWRPWTTTAWDRAATQYRW